MTSGEDDVEDRRQGFGYRCPICYRVWGFGEDKYCLSVIGHEMCSACFRGMSPKKLLKHKARYIFGMAIDDALKVVDELRLHFKEKQREIKAKE